MHDAKRRFLRTLRELVNAGLDKLSAKSDATNSTQRPRFQLTGEIAARTAGASLRWHSLERRLVAGGLKHAVPLV
jgi:hypothetical protein